MSLKLQISLPLYAGTSIFDGHHLPSHAHSALEYAAKRLCRKNVPVTLVVVRRDYQLFGTEDVTVSASRRATPSLNAANRLPSSSSSFGATASTFVASSLDVLKHLVHPTRDDKIQERIVPAPTYDRYRDAAASPTFSELSAASASTSSATTVSTAASESRFPSQFSPTFDQRTAPVSTATTPVTPGSTFTLASSLSSAATLSTAATTETGSMGSGLTAPGGDFGVRFVHTTPLGLREERVLRQTFRKTARKFRMGADWLPQPVAPSAYGLTTDLVQRSVTQGAVLFSADGLVLVALDHLYAFKAALRSYAHTRAPRRLEDAVDELRRLVLAKTGPVIGDGRGAVRKRSLLEAYPWLGTVDDAALGDVDRMYRRAYGGGGAIIDDVEGAPWPLLGNNDSHDSRSGNNGRSSVELQVCPCGRVGGRRVSKASRASTPRLDKPLPVIPRHEAASPTRSQSQLRPRPRLQYEPSELREARRRERVVVLSQLGQSPERSATLASSKAGVSGAEIGVEVEGRVEVEVAFHPDDIESWFVSDDDDDDDDDDAEGWYRQVDSHFSSPATAPAPAPPAGEEVMFMMAMSSEPIARSSSAPQEARADSAAATLHDMRRAAPKSPRMAAPVLKLQTSFAQPLPRPEPRPVPAAAGGGGQPQAMEIEIEDDEELTARPKSSAQPQPELSLPGQHQHQYHLGDDSSSSNDSLLRGRRWTSMSIDEMLTPAVARGAGAGSDRVGPLTPNGYDDISPITRGEWGFLMVGVGGEFNRRGKTAAVETGWE